MNYLAHLYLSFDDEDQIIGNFIADAIKGKKYQQYPKGIAFGILKHREIDRYMDSHPIVKQGKRRLSNYGHFSGVVMDIFYDHFLSNLWTDYSKESLESFTQRHYKILKKNKQYLPPKMSYILGHMSSGDWLYNYQYIEGVQFALSGMASRVKYESGMQNATQELKLYYDEYEKEFQLYFSQIIAHIHNFTPPMI